MAGHGAEDDWFAPTPSGKEMTMRAFPDIVQSVRPNIGTGLPSMDNTHEVAQAGIVARLMDAVPPAATW